MHWARGVVERTAFDEAVIVGLYTAVMQLSVLAAWNKDEPHVQARVLIGTGIGILCAHLFAASLGRQYLAEGETVRFDISAALGIFAGVIVVTGISLVPYIVFSDADDPGNIASFFLVFVIAYAGFSSSRSAGRSLTRAVLTAVVMAVIATAVAILKAVLTH
jgi:uncharacterized membrane protein